MGLFDDLTKSLGSITGGSSGQQNQGSSGLGALLGSAAAGGILGALLGGSKGVQKAAKNAAAIGIGAGGAMLAYKLFQKWQQGRSADAPAPAAGAPQSIQGAVQGWSGAGTPALAQAADAQAEILLEAMVFAARADGHIDAQEEKLILQSAGQLAPGGDLQLKLSRYLNCPLDPNDLAAKVSDMEQKRDLYLLSALIAKPDTFMEQNYLAALAQALGLSAELKAELDNTAAAQRQALLTAS